MILELGNCGSKKGLKGNFSPVKMMTQISFLKSSVDNSEKEDGFADQPSCIKGFSNQ